MARPPTSRCKAIVAGTLILAGADTLAHYAQVLEAVSYRSTAADPTSGGANAERTIAWQVNDGALDSQTRETRLHIDRPPVLGLDPANPGSGFLTTYTENATAIAVAGSGIAITDPDSPTIGLAVITLTNAKPFDSLSVDGPLPGGIGFSLDTSVAGAITLRLFNAASLADYQAAIALVKFRNASDAPDLTDRDITVTVSGGTAQSNVAHTTVHVLGVNDAPVNTRAGHAGGRGQSARARSPGLSVADLDAGAGALTHHARRSQHGTLTVAAVGGAAVVGQRHRHGHAHRHARGRSTRRSARPATSSTPATHDFFGTDTLTHGDERRRQQRQRRRR